MKKGLKVTNVDRQKKVGIAAENLKELIEKSCKKFQISNKGCKLYVAEDGTLIDDDEYLATIQPQTLLVIVEPHQQMKTDFNYLYEMIKSSKGSYLKAGEEARNFMTENIKDKLKVLERCIKHVERDTILCTKRDDDPEWFKGLIPSEKTKEIAMGKRCKERMLGYYYKVKTNLQNSHLYTTSKNGITKTIIDKFLQDLRNLLEKNKYNMNYFDRTAADNERFCNNEGNFLCGGLWNVKSCVYEDHTINPYRSREERILFQTWNLDHKIELSRAILPKILETIQGLSKKLSTCSKCKKNCVNGFVSYDKYYIEIFTRHNLKLVHIVCHDKGKHDASTCLFVLCNKCYDKQVNGSKKNI